VLSPSSVAGELARIRGAAAAAAAVAATLLTLRWWWVAPPALLNTLALDGSSSTCTNRRSARWTNAYASELNKKATHTTR